MPDLTTREQELVLELAEVLGARAEDRDEVLAHGLPGVQPVFTHVATMRAARLDAWKREVHRRYAAIEFSLDAEHAPLAARILALVDAQTVPAEPARGIRVSITPKEPPP